MGRIANTVGGRGYVEHVAPAARRRHLVVGLLIGDNDEAVVTILKLALNLGERACEIGSPVGLVVVKRISR